MQICVFWGIWDQKGGSHFFSLRPFLLQNQSLEAEFRFPLEIGNTLKSPGVFTFVFVYLSAASVLYFF